MTSQLISTLPLDTLLTWMGHESLARRLTYSSTHIIGLGLRGQNPHDTKCWLYYPEDDCPYYRCTVFSHYAKKNVPADDVLLPTLRHGKSVCFMRFVVAWENVWIIVVVALISYFDLVC